MSSELFSLIKSFSTKEKGAFKQFAESVGNTETNHVHLFDKYNQATSLTSQTEECIRREIGITSKNAYSKCKAYLHEWLFRFLRYNYANKDEKEIRLEVKMTNLYLDVLILMELRKKRDLREVLNKKIEEAKQFAYSYYFFLDLIKILHIQKFIFRDVNPNVQKLIPALDEEITDVYRALKLEHDLVGRYEQLYQLEKRQDLTLLKAELNRNFEYINSLNISRMTLRIKMTMQYIKEKYYTYIKNDLQEITKNLEDAIQFIVTNKKLLNDQQERYLNLEMNYINSLVVSNTLSEEKIKISSDRINLITPRNDDIKRNIEQFKCYYELQFLFGSYQFDKVLKMQERVAHIVENREAYQLSDSKIFVFQYMIAFASFICGKSNALAMSKAENIALTTRNNYTLTHNEELRNEFLLIAIMLEEERDTNFEHYYNRIKYLISIANPNSYDTEKELLNGLNQVLNKIGKAQKVDKTNLKGVELQKIHDKLEVALAKDYREFLYWMHPALYQ